MDNKIAQLFSTNPIKSKFCELHHIGLEDAELIYNLRTNRKGNFLRPISGTIEDQRQYLRDYFERFARKEEIYYKVLDNETQKFSGILRLTQILDEKTFNWQSFIVTETASPNTPIDAMLTIYRIGFEFLGREICGPWEVNKNFTKMIKIHNIIQMAKIVSEDEPYFHFAIKKTDYQNNMGRFLKMGYGKLFNLL